MINRESALRGVKSVTPLMLGVAPFGLISGITAANAGLSIGVTILMSVGVFAGAAQLAALQLINDNANMLVIIYTALIINIRMIIYSLSIAPYLQKLKVRWKALLAYCMTDQSYAISLVHSLKECSEINI